MVKSGLGRLFPTHQPSLPRRGVNFTTSNVSQSNFNWLNFHNPKSSLKLDDVNSTDSLSSSPSPGYWLSEFTFKLDSRSRLLDALLRLLSLFSPSATSEWMRRAFLFSFYWLGQHTTQTTHSRSLPHTTFVLINAENSFTIPKHNWHGTWKFSIANCDIDNFSMDLDWSLKTFSLRFV